MSRPVAIMVDQRIVATPRIDPPAPDTALTPDTALISRRTDNQRQAVELAALLRFGPLPVRFTVEHLSTR